MKLIVSHPQGNRNVRAVISALDAKGLLTEFNTTISINPEASWLKLLPAKVVNELKRRTFPISGEKIHTHPLRELVRMTGPKMGFKILTAHERGWASVDAVYRDFDAAVAKRLPELSEKGDLRAIYAYEDGALESFRTAKKLGLKCVYDLPIAYWETGRQLMQEDAERLPEWKITLGGGIADSVLKLERKTQELELADMVVGPGQFVMDSLPAWAKTKKIVMAPFGSPATPGENLNQTVGSSSIPLKPLRVLFVGSMGQRKGLGDLFEAMKILNRKEVELVVMGSLLAPLSFYKSQFEDFTYEPGRSHEQVLELMRSCDVFCLPSIVEGRALVMQEAMSQQLPLIITPNTGGSDLIVEAETGFLVPIRSPEKIAQKINWFLENRKSIPEMGVKAQAHAAGYTWERYGDSISNELIHYLNNK